MKALSNATLFDFETYRPGNYLLFDKTVVATGPMEEFPGADQVTDVAGAWVMPGLVAGHTHLFKTFARGWDGEGARRGFVDGLDLEAVAFSGRVGALASLKAGITTVVDHHASGAVGGSLTALRNTVVDETGLRGIFAFEANNTFDLEACIEESKSFARHPGPRSAGMLGLTAGPSLSDKSLDRVARTTGTLPIHVHLGGTPENTGTMSRLEARGLWRPGSLAVYEGSVDAAELELLASRAVPLVLNPSSMLSTGWGVPDLRMLHGTGIKTTLGTDGLGFGLGTEMRNLVLGQPRGTDCRTALDATVATLRATWEFAGDALGCQLGRFVPGYEADFVVVEYQAPSPLDTSNALTHWFQGLLEAWHPRYVWVAGTPRLTDFKPAVHEAELHREARRVAAALWKRLL